MVSHMGKDEAERFGQTIAAQIRAEMAAKSVTVSGLARAIHINRETLDRWVKGTRPMNVPTLHLIADALSLDPHLIVRRAEERFAAESEEKAQPGDAVITHLGRVGLDDDEDDWEAEDAMGYAAKKKSSAEELDNDSV